MREFTEQEQVRRNTLEEMRTFMNPYPERFSTNYELKDASKLEDGTLDVRVAGRIVLMRKMGKMAFLTIQDIEGRIQVSIKIDVVGEEKYNFFKKYIDLGDFIGVEGEVFTTHTGEKTVRADGDVVGKVVYTIDEKISRKYLKKH